MVKIAILGIGKRGQKYGNIASKLKNVSIVALCESKEQFLNAYAQKWGVDKSNCYTSDSQFFGEGKLADAVFICTQDRDHYRHAVLALNKGYHVLLEKPVSPNYDECVEIARLAKQKNLQVVVCHVLRYSPFYVAIKKAIDDGLIGDVVHINHTENVGYWHFAHSYVRGNWRKESESSPSILAKCCHDLDMIYWWSGKKAVTVSSYGRLDFFTSKNRPVDAPSHCVDGCDYSVKCPYYAPNIYYRITRHTLPKMIVNAFLVTDSPHPTLREIKDKLATSPYGRCVFACDNDVMEEQVVNLVLQDGVTATLNMTAFSKRMYRKTHIYGTKGEIYGNDTDGAFTINTFGGQSRRIRTSRKSISIHGSCDSNTVKQFIALLDGQSTHQGLTFIDTTLQSHLVATYAERARKSGLTEQINE
ncbi:MAG: Gfo/Idh/MocA family oxidoreductase [Clostridia bacterium]|nr:Gfo/Idh/MocA family oxidoreductase [Clostridia bacterium]